MISSDKLFLVSVPRTSAADRVGATRPLPTWPARTATHRATTGPARPAGGPPRGRGIRGPVRTTARPAGTPRTDDPRVYEPSRRRRPWRRGSGTTRAASGGRAPSRGRRRTRPGPRGPGGCRAPGRSAPSTRSHAESWANRGAPSPSRRRGRGPAALRHPADRGMPGRVEVPES